MRFWACQWRRLTKLGELELLLVWAPIPNLQAASQWMAPRENLSTSWTERDTYSFVKTYMAASASSCIPRQAP